MARIYQLPPLTLYGQSLLLIVAELLANAICWIVAGILFGRKTETQPMLSLALLAWTIGLRHALDADHISAIDNATRGLIALGQIPVTCGLFFSLGHSTIVIVVNVAIAISSDIYNKIHRVGSVGRIIGAAVSGSFLFLVGLANSILLWRIVKKRRQSKKPREDGENPLTTDDDNGGHRTQMLMMRILGPIMTFVNRPWKMYPVGLLFGLGFDTASSIALLAVSAIARKGSDGKTIPAGSIVILPLLFTAAMTLIDSLDSILVLYSYLGFPGQRWTIFEPSNTHKARGGVLAHAEQPVDSSPKPSAAMATQTSSQSTTTPSPRFGAEIGTEMGAEVKANRDLRVKQNVMSGLSIVLTLVSILVAFSVSLITIMGLIGENCRPCREAAEAEGGRGGGIPGRWWRGWAKANDNSGFIGAAIVGAFILVIVGWYGGRWSIRKWKTGRMSV